jgi:thiol-disulfide isomerase/thioredoxin
MFIELENDNLAEIIASNPKTIVQFSAGWCGNCKIMKPKFKKSETEHTDIMYVIVDAEKFTQSRTLAQVDNLPTFASFLSGQLHTQVQTNKADVLNEFIDEVVNQN